MAHRTDGLANGFAGLAAVLAIAAGVLALSVLVGTLDASPWLPVTSVLLVLMVLALLVPVYRTWGWVTRRRSRG